MTHWPAQDPQTLAWYAQRKPQFLGGHDVTLLRGATQMFPALTAAIDNATTSVWLATYLVSEAGQTLHVIEALCRAAKRGVAVHMVVDGAGSGDVPEAVWQKIRDSGVQWAVFRPMGPWWQVMLDTAQWRRMHIKLCVIDAHEAFTGGINMIDDCYDLDHGWSDKPRLDYAVRFTGPSVLPALQTARAMWTRASLGHDWREDLSELLHERGRIQRVKQLWRHARLLLPKNKRAELAEDFATDAPMQAAFVLRDNLRQRRTIERAAIRAILRSRHKVDIVTPYFYPGLSLKRALVFAAKRGVQVRLLLQGKPDYRLAALAARVLYRELQAQGVRIFEYQAAMLHAKVICVDESWATVGSSNLDPLSMVMNLEANLIVRDKKFAATLADQLAFDFTQSLEVVSNGTFYRLQHNRLTRAVVAGVAKLYLRLAGIAKHY